MITPDFAQRFLSLINGSTEEREREGVATIGNKTQTGKFPGDMTHLKI